MNARDRYKRALECVAKMPKGLDDPNLQLEFARVMTMFDSVDELTNIRASIPPMVQNAPQTPNNVVSAPISSEPAQSTTMMGSIPQMP